MKTLTIMRFKNIYDGTLGRFVLADEFGAELLCGYTLEPAGADEVRSGLDRRIPQGQYNATWEHSPRFGRSLPVLSNKQVAKARRILIHIGNYPTNTEGCILLGASSACITQGQNLKSLKRLSVWMIL